MSSSEISALISLIEDPDEGIFTQVRDELISKGEQVIPHLEHYWEINSFGTLFQDRVENLIHSIHYQCIHNGLRHWMENDENDLLSGALLINRYQYPSFEEAEVRRQINALRQDIWLELNDQLTAIERVNVINHILFTVYGFEGNKQNYTAPQNSYLADVLGSKKGNPLSLAVIYQVLANALDIPIYGVNLPNHFVLAYLDEQRIGLAPEEQPDGGVLFYINPFSGGSIIHKDEIDAFLLHLNLPKRVAFYQPCRNKIIVQRMVTNLIYAYQQQGNRRKVDELKELQAVFKIGSSEPSEE